VSSQYEILEGPPDHMEPPPEEGYTDVDLELLRAAQSAPEGDLRAFEELVMRHQQRILANCRFLTRDERSTSACINSKGGARSGTGCSG